MTDRTLMQVAEALGPVNRWYCSQFCGREVSDPEVLVRYFVRSGGAADFARRWDEAMGLENRWYCSEFYGRDVREPRVLWGYYVMALGRRGAA
jgi:hypothetical protein